MDELGAERHVELEQLGVAPLRAEAGYSDEAVEVLDPPARGVVVDGVTAAEQNGRPVDLFRYLSEKDPSGFKYRLPFKDQVALYRFAIERLRHVITGVEE